MQVGGQELAIISRGQAAALQPGCHDWRVTDGENRFWVTVGTQDAACMRTHAQAQFFKFKFQLRLPKAIF